jgi:hypothetical protein
MYRARNYTDKLHVCRAWCTFVELHILHILHIHSYYVFFLSSLFAYPRPPPQNEFLQRYIRTIIRLYILRALPIRPVTSVYDYNKSIRIRYIHLFHC